MILPAQRKELIDSVSFKKTLSCFFIVEPVSEKDSKVKKRKKISKPKFYIYYPFFNIIWALLSQVNSFDRFKQFWDISLDNFWLLANKFKALFRASVEFGSTKIEVTLLVKILDIEGKSEAIIGLPEAKYSNIFIGDE